MTLKFEIPLIPESVLITVIACNYTLSKYKNNFKTKNVGI